MPSNYGKIANYLLNVIKKNYLPKSQINGLLKKVKVKIVWIESWRGKE